jgi:hypothetical protein
MPLTNVCLTLLLVAAGAVAWNLEGSEAAGVVVGALLAAGLTGLGLAYQRQALRRTPHLAVGILGLFMVVKIFALFAVAATLRFVPALAERADWESFVLAFAPVAVLALIVGAAETMAGLRTSASVEG